MCHRLLKLVQFVCDKLKENNLFAHLEIRSILVLSRSATIEFVKKKMFHKPLNRSYAEECGFFFNGLNIKSKTFLQFMHKTYVTIGWKIFLEHEI